MEKGPQTTLTYQNFVRYTLTCNPVNFVHSLCGYLLVVFPLAFCCLNDVTGLLKKVSKTTLVFPYHYSCISLALFGLFVQSKYIAFMYHRNTPTNIPLAFIGLDSGRVLSEGACEEAR